MFFFMFSPCVFTYDGGCLVLKSISFFFCEKCKFFVKFTFVKKEKNHKMSGGMIRLKDEKQRRNTLNVGSFLSASTIKPINTSNVKRLISLSPVEINDLTWLKRISNGKTCSYIPPAYVKPNEANATEHISEKQLTERQKDSEVSFTADSFYNYISSGAYEAKYKSIPLRDQEFTKIIDSYKYIFSTDYDKVSFLHVTGFHLEGKSGVGTNSCVRVFSWNDSPTCEPVNIDFSQDEPLCSTYGQLHDDFFLPYIQSPKSRFVAVLYSLETSDKGVIEKPIAIGHKLYSELHDEASISLNWVVFNSSMTFEQHFSSDKKFPIFDFVFDVIPNAELPDCEAPNQYSARLTANHSLYPSPLLTFYNLNIHLKAESVPRGAQLFCKIIIKTNEEQPKTLNVAAKSNGSILTDSFRTCNIAVLDSNFFPEEFNFKIDSRNDIEDLQATIEVYQCENKKEKLLYDATVPITNTSGSIKTKLKSRALFGSGQASLDISYFYPAVVQPPLSLKKSLLIDPSNPIDSLPNFDHPMFQDVAPYILQLLFSADLINVVDFQKLSKIIEKCDKEWIFKWIEHSFWCSNEFPQAYIKALIKNINNFGSVPLQYFLILFKSLVTVKKPYTEEITNLLVTVANENVSINTKIAAAKFLCQSRMFFHITFLAKPALSFLRLLKTPERLKIFQILFSDPAVIQTIVPPFRNELHGVYSPYIPVLSLFFSTVHETFLANNKAAIEPSITAIAILACSLEGYCEGDTSLIVAYNFFPLVTLIFTFYDSLIPHIGTNTVLVPFLLFIFQFCNDDQFIGYYNLLSDYNKLRFLDLCASISDEATIKGLSPRIEGINGNELTVSYEITWRLMLFLRFIENIKEIEDAQLRSVFKIIIHMLSPKQDSEAFPMVFASLAFVVRKFQDNVFTKQTNHILYIMASVVPLTQRKTAAARITALAFMRYLVSLENSRKKKGEKGFRCFISLMFAFVKSLFENNNFDFKASTIDQHYAPIDDMVNGLKDAWHSSPVYFKCVSDMLDAYKCVRSVKGAAFLTYKELVRINAANNDFCAAFICQWRLCAIICQVFKLSNKVPDGIPKEGASVFPFIPSDFFENESTLPDAQYLLLEGDMFSEESINNELQTALEYCRKAGLHWLAGSITEILLNFLEAHRKFDTLQSVFSIISQSYTVLAQSDKPALEFYLVQFRGPIAQKLELSTAVQVLSFKENPNYKEECKDEEYHYEERDQNLELVNYKNMLLKADPSIIFLPESHNLLFRRKDIPKDKSYCQIMKVEYDQKELSELEAKTFTLEFVEKEDEWYKDYVIKFVFKTKDTLPGPVSITAVCDKQAIIIKRKDFYFDTLVNFSNKLTDKVAEFRAVMPPAKLATAWTKWSLGLNTDELINLIKKCLDDNVPEDDKKKKRAPLSFVKKYKLSLGDKKDDVNYQGFNGLENEDKVKMIEYCNQVWKKMIDAIAVIDELYILNNRDRQNGLVGDPSIQKYKEILIPQKEIIKELV